MSECIRGSPSWGSGQDGRLGGDTTVALLGKLNSLKNSSSVRECVGGLPQKAFCRSVDSIFGYRELLRLFPMSSDTIEVLHKPKVPRWSHCFRPSLWKTQSKYSFQRTAWAVCSLQLPCEESQDWRLASLTLQSGWAGGSRTPGGARSPEEKRGAGETVKKLAWNPGEDRWRPGSESR